MLSHPSCLTDSKKERSIRCLGQGLQLGVGLQFSCLGDVCNITLAFVALSPPTHTPLFSPSLDCLGSGHKQVNLNTLD